jgi:hypothetical protein
MKTIGELTTEIGGIYQATIKNFASEFNIDLSEGFSGPPGYVRSDQLLTDDFYQMLLKHKLAIQAFHHDWYGEVTLGDLANRYNLDFNVLKEEYLEDRPYYRDSEIDESTKVRYASKYILILRSLSRPITIEQYEELAFGKFVDDRKSKVHIFISYSHVDSKWLTELKRHLNSLDLNIEVWDDSRIETGDVWRVQIKEAIERSTIGLLLVSADFFSSKFIMENELPPLLESATKMKSKIVSVILKPCLFEEYSEISKYQAINSPAEPVIGMDEYHRELLWVELTRRIQKLSNK